MESSEKVPILKSVTVEDRIDSKKCGDIRCDGEINIDGDINSDGQEKPEFSFSGVPRQKKILLISMALVNFFSCTCFSLLAPFFPAEASRKGSTQAVTGMIFGVFEFVIFLTSPIFGNFITRIGSKFMFICGTMLCGACAILFGVLDKSPDGEIYIIMCFACRIIEATGASMFITASFAIIANAFPDHVTTVFGTLETFSGLGLLCGPVVGGALYELGGFGLPFFVIGSVVICNGILCSGIMGKQNDEPKPRTRSVLYLLKSPFTWITALSITSGSFALGFLDPTLSLHLSKLPELNGKTWLIGFMFLIGAGMYTLTAPLWGYLTDKKGYVKVMMVIGNLVGMVSYLTIGPTPLIPGFPFELWTQIVALILMGLGLGCALIPTFRVLLNIASDMGLPDNFDTQGIVSGLFNSCFSLGAFLGPTVGGVLVNEFGFDWASTVCAGFVALSSVFVIIYGLFKCSSRHHHLQGYEEIVTSNVESV